MPSSQMRCMITANRRASATIAFFIPRRLAICIAQALSHDHFFEYSRDQRRAGERLAYSVDEVAQITGLSRDLLYHQMRTGRLGYIKVGRRRIITRQHLDAFLARAAS